MLSDADSAKMIAITTALDVTYVRNTEPTLGTNKERVIIECWSSATVGFRYKRIYNYLNPALSPAWGALSEMYEIVEAL